jgi:uncharacterized protein YecT (DUF1311 family)
MLRITICATLMMFLTMGTVSAQMPQPGMHLNEDYGNRPRTKEQKQYDRDLDRAYQDAKKKIPDAQKKSDPWGDIRSTSPGSAKNKQQ